MLTWSEIFYAICYIDLYRFTQPKECKLQQVCWHLAKTCYNKPISGGCVCMACDSFLTTSLLQVVHRLVASWLLRLVICYKLFQQVVISCSLMKFTNLLNKFSQAGKIAPLQQVCSVFGCVLCSNQANIRMGLHQLLRLDDKKSFASFQQAWCKLIVNYSET